MTINRVLIVDDMPDICELIQDALSRKNLVGDVCYTLNQAKEKLIRNHYDLILTDMNLAGQSAMELISHVVNKYPETPIVMMSGYGNQDVSVSALKLGAFDFLNKPIDPRILDNLINAVNEKDRNTPNTEILKQLIGESEPIKTLKDRINRIATGQAPVLITGESGVGKEIVASTIHSSSNRASGPFVAINCGAIPEDLLESELFGHVKGAFTGATVNKIGLIQLAHQGTLFLDEVAELPLMMQAKLLRAVQEKKIRPVGGDREVVVDFRIISATHQNLEKLVSERKFRQDLYFRLHVMDVSVPALRERGRDVLVLANHYCKTTTRDWGLPDIRISTRAKEWLLEYSFPGNVRELINIIQRAVTLCNGEEITVEDIEGGAVNATQKFAVSVTNNFGGIDVGVEPIGDNQHLQQMPSAENIRLLLNQIGVPKQFFEMLSGGLPITSITDVGLDEHLKNTEKSAVEFVLAAVHGNKKLAAKKLKVTVRSLRYRMKKYGIAGADDDDDD